MKRQRGAKPGRKEGTAVGAYTQRYAAGCVWCGREFLSSRPDAKCDAIKCKQALYRFRKKYGHDPLAPPGRVGLAQAIGPKKPRKGKKGKK